MNLHDKIMNIPCIFQELMSDREKIAHKIGHRDARHAAAEMANEADEIISELLEALEELDAFCETGFENGTERKYVGSDTMHMVLKAITKAKGLDK